MTAELLGNIRGPAGDFELPLEEHLTFFADNTWDVGIAEFRPRDVRAGRDVIAGRMVNAVSVNAQQATISDRAEVGQLDLLGGRTGFSVTTGRITFLLQNSQDYSGRQRLMIASSQGMQPFLDNLGPPGGDWLPVIPDLRTQSVSTLDFATPLQLGSGGLGMWAIENPAGTWSQLRLRPLIDNMIDIGAPTSRVRELFVGANVNAGGVNVIGTVAANLVNVIGVASANSFRANFGSAGAPGYAFQLSSNAGMFGVGGGLGFSTAGVSRWQITGAGHLVAATDGAFDIGAAGATRPRDVYVAQDVYLGRDPTQALQAVTKQYVDGLVGGGGSLSWPLLGPSGSRAAPSYSFADDPSSGLWAGGAWIELRGSRECYIDAATHLGLQGQTSVHIGGNDTQITGWNSLWISAPLIELASPTSIRDRLGVGTAPDPFAGLTVRGGAFANTLRLVNTLTGGGTWDIGEATTPGVLTFRAIDTLGGNVSVANIAPLTGLTLAGNAIASGFVQAGTAMFSDTMGIWAFRLAIGATPNETGYGFRAPNVADARGQGYANQWVNASAARFKRNVAAIPDALGLVLDESLRGVYFDNVNDRVAGEPETTSHQIGFVADDWLAKVPEIVSVQDGEVMGMAYSGVTPILWEALKQLAARVAELEARLA